MSAKHLLRVAWIAHLSVLIGASLAVVFGWPGRTEHWARLLPLLLGGVALEGAAAAGGSSLKRLTEAAVERAKNGGATVQSVTGFVGEADHEVVGLGDRGDPRRRAGGGGP